MLLKKDFFLLKIVNVNNHFKKTKQTKKRIKQNLFTQDPLTTAVSKRLRKVTRSQSFLWLFLVWVIF